MTDAPEKVAELLVPDRFEVVPLDSLRPADSPRSSGEDEAHARMLADLDVDLPPVLVNRRTMRIIDGSHRVIAASLRGERTKERTSKELLAQASFRAKNLSEGRTRAIHLDGRDTSSEDVHAMGTPRRLFELEKARSTFAMKHAENVAEGSALKAAGDVHGKDATKGRLGWPNLEPSRACMVRISPMPRGLPAHALVIGSALLLLAACDTKEPKGSSASGAPASPVPPPVATPSSSAVAAASASAAASAAPTAHAMPERPVPKESPTVRANMSPEIQMKAIAYMAAMRAPGPDDPPADAAYAEEVRKKLETVIRGADHGGATTHAEIVGGGRQIDLLMHGGCDDKAPARYASQGGYTLAILRARGIFVVRCNGSNVQCLQSTRDPSDILCTTAPRHP